MRNRRVIALLIASYNVSGLNIFFIIRRYRERKKKEEGRKAGLYRLTSIKVSKSPNVLV
jgi:hypothetical protein